MTAGPRPHPHSPPPQTQPTDQLHRPEPDAPVYFEPATRPLRVQRGNRGQWQTQTVRRPRPKRRRVDPAVVIAAVIMCALAIGVIVGLATL
ncbi:hypothetical protein AAFP35_25925 [Gordonia sp. CPCC 206044]|uniref:hypothetical protein n=1 Tax=Gordonia sp. CPCC 206044 TaxID=3140793 RepID=UPI003AF3A86A